MMIIKEQLRDLLAEGFLNHFSEEMNSTIPLYPMLMYCFIYALGLKNVLEVGTLRGYTSYYLARAANVNGGHYYGIDVHKPYCDIVKKGLDSFNLSNSIICADTKTMDRIDFTDRIDFAFLDGEHTTHAVLHEVDMIYPLLNSHGNGFIFIHDIIDQGNSDAWWKLKQDPRFEGIGVDANYGLGMLRKMEGVDYRGLAKKYGKLRYDGEPIL
jgi:predicted O-methyltransferase YrrM